MNTPKKLYKYETISVQSLINLKSQVVYFSPPSGFNDPYDCAIKAQIEDPTSQELEELKKIYLTKEWPTQILDKLSKTPLEELKPMLMSAAREANRIVIDSFIENKGVSCFSEVCDDLLMWGHYSGKYTGFCLEFDTKNDLFKKAKKVTYVDNMPKLNVLSVYGEGRRGDIIELFCTKSKSWEYEKEWRCIHNEAGTAYTYSADALTGVYFGPKTNSHMVEVICLILQGQNSNVRFWKGKRSEHSFKVEFEEFFYTSYLRAKELGLK
ncbi:DUF2971 domain-containing protein [Aeromonas caviae]|uniref:DUF2971 domain-containing protein n=1 Tax=Aeromonas caviae TaxID=648 RepID=UPI001243A419|nr:DUF2971 domain-containing protein [Aeromonas caviae]KAB0675579.1 DUF2971 domain-containing protein [Aeromonas caviae]